MKKLIQNLLEKSKSHPFLIVGLSGIDGSGKGYLSKLMAEELNLQGLKTTIIGIDSWLQPPSKRFSMTNQAKHFYENGFRFKEMKDMLFAPLKQNGKVHFTAKHSSPTNGEDLIDYEYSIANFDIIIFEGIFLFNGMFDFDYKIWIDCSKETALKRALIRNQEGLSETGLRRDYRNIYFAAQDIHFEKDFPEKQADYILNND